MEKKAMADELECTDTNRTTSDKVNDWLAVGALWFGWLVAIGTVAFVILVGD
jgi:hypothetical protein